MILCSSPTTTEGTAMFNSQTTEAPNHLAGSLQDLHPQTAPLLDRASERASALAQRGLDAVRDSSQQLREQAHRASDGTLGYIRDEPLKSILFAAATGAALMALLSLMGSSRQRR
jgi:ElaB/YqjD/DUF883 family membrane-anchored ribosome-binding protein